MKSYRSIVSVASLVLAAAFTVGTAQASGPKRLSGVIVGVDAQAGSGREVPLAVARRFRRRPVRLVYSEHFELILDAIAAERRIKGWSRAKKQALIRRDYDALPTLAKRRTK